MSLLLRFWWAPVIALALGLAAYQTNRLHSTQEALAGAKSDLAAMSAAKAQSEALRGQEAAEATEAYSALQTTCTANFQAAIQRGRIVERIVNAPPNPDGSRGLVDADSLRSLVGQEAGPVGPAEAVSTGGNR